MCHCCVSRNPDAFFDRLNPPHPASLNGWPASRRPGERRVVHSAKMLPVPIFQGNSRAGQEAILFGRAGGRGGFFLFVYGVGGSRLRCGLQTTTACVASVSALYILWPGHCSATGSFGGGFWLPMARRPGPRGEGFLDVTFFGKRSYGNHPIQRFGRPSNFSTAIPTGRKKSGVGMSPNGANLL